MTMLKAVLAIQTSDGALFGEAEYGKAVKHEKMVQAGIEYQNIIAGDYLREWLEENQDENAIDLISDPAIVSFAKALLVAASDHKQAMNDDMSFCDSLDEALLVEGDEYAVLDEVDFPDIDSYPTELHLIDEMSKHSDLVRAGLVSEKLIDVYTTAFEEHKRISEKNKPIAMMRPSRKKQDKAKKQPKPEESNEADSLYLEAVELVRSGDIRPSGKALRERFGIRHDRASEIMKCMVADGVVSTPMKGVRTVLSQIA